LHYFLILIAEQQKSAKEYNTKRFNGKAILDEVLLVNLNPQTLKGEVRDLYGHQFVCLNPNHPDKDTPQQIRKIVSILLLPKTCGKTDTIFTSKNSTSPKIHYKNFSANQDNNIVVNYHQNQSHLPPTLRHIVHQKYY
jgi:hypothetical protein